MEWRYCLLFAALIMVQSGCRSLSPGDAESPLEKLTSRLSLSETKSKPDATKQNNEAEPTRIAVIWKENILQSDGGRPKQGFTGRIYFYDQAGEVVKASGSLNVYGYEDSGDIKRVVPDKNFVFEADKFASHYSPSEIGHSYSIWIPWCDYGGFRKSITLVPVFKTSNGKIVQGTADYLSLSGKTPKAQNLEKTIASPSIDARNDRRSQQSQAEAFANSAAAYLKSRNAVRASQSIPVPQSISDHWAHSNNSRNQSAQASLPQAQTQAQQLINQASLNGVGVNQVHTYNQQLTNPTRYTRATQTATLGHPQAGQTFPVSTAPNAAQQPAPTFPPQHGHPQSLGFSSQSLQTQQQPYAMQQPQWHARCKARPTSSTSSSDAARDAVYARSATNARNAANARNASHTETAHSTWHAYPANDAYAANDAATVFKSGNESKRFRSIHFVVHGPCQTIRLIRWQLRVP